MPCLPAAAICRTSARRINWLPPAPRTPQRPPKQPAAEAAEVADQVIAPTVPLSNQEPLDRAPPVTTPVQETADAFAAPAKTAVEQVAMATPGSNEIQDLLSSQELGGRIVSVKSDAVTLEWSPAER